MLLSYLTEQTCGDACWHAKEDVCRCSCGGKNHGVLRTKDGDQPVRTAKIDGVRYELRATGKRQELYSDAKQINTLLNDGSKRYRRIERPITCSDGSKMQYKYTWKETDPHAPARLKYPTKAQLAKWPEMSAYRDLEPWDLRDISILWVRCDMPNQPTEPILTDDQKKATQQEPQGLKYRHESPAMVDTGDGAPQYTFAPTGQLSLL